ncbi:MAG: phosphoribosylglycinamide formyltransferase [Bacteroidales bacterium]|jgi:phosphoribosylglycinamide formyltransferase-1|nr:phosphoribosylglycinamide formyltransferase [Bacteroidales bacterium]
MTKIAIFASGSGTNAENIINSFSGTPLTIISIFCNKKNAGIIDRAKRLSVPCRIFSREEFYDSNAILSELISQQVDYIILAGFLWKIPESLIKAFPNKIINIHPALLPNYGGKGMYGSFVHEAVITNKEKESGITIHLVDEKYDNGTIIFQARCQINPDDTPESLAAKVHELEYMHLPSVIRKYIEKGK